MSQITNEGELLDLLPLSLIGIKIHDEILLLKFSDGRYVIYKSRTRHEDSCIEFLEHSPCIYEKKELDIISPQEYDVLIEKARLARIATDEKRQREQYEQLKAKFEPNR